MGLVTMGGIKVATHFHFDSTSDNEPLQGEVPLINKWFLPFHYLWIVQMNHWCLLRSTGGEDIKNKYQGLSCPGNVQLESEQSLNTEIGFSAEWKDCLC